MLKNKGTRSIHVRASTMDTMCITLAVTLDGGESMLPPMLIFKGTLNGRIAKHEFATYPIGGHYICQPKEWMDKQAMHMWIDCVLIPWKNTKAPGVDPILILDAYRVHMGNIVNCIQSLRIVVSTSLQTCVSLWMWALTSQSRQQ